MEITFFEDPACCWCWAFEPVSTAFQFEFRDAIRSQIKARRVMGGLRDRPVADVDFVMYQWKQAEAVSGMPFDASIWKKRALQTTFPACRAVKAADLMEPGSGDRLLRRLREAFYVEQISIDDKETILRLAAEVNLASDPLGEHLANGRAEALFERDRMEASEYGFGFPTITIRDKQHETPVVLQGSVPYSDLLHALSAMGISPAQRQRFRDTRENWEQLFAVHPRLTLTELRLVTGIEKTKLAHRLEQLGAVREGCFYRLALPGEREAERIRHESQTTDCDALPSPGFEPRHEPQARNGVKPSHSEEHGSGTNGLSPKGTADQAGLNRAHDGISSSSPGEPGA